MVKSKGFEGEERNIIHHNSSWDIFLHSFIYADMVDGLLTGGRMFLRLVSLLSSIGESGLQKSCL